VAIKAVAAKATLAARNEEELTPFEDVVSMTGS
jgi:hypothetical protein